MDGNSSPNFTEKSKIMEHSKYRMYNNTSKLIHNIIVCTKMSKE